MNIKRSLIEAIDADPRTRRAIAKEAKIGLKTLYKLIGGGNVTLDIADRVARVIGMTFRPLSDPEKQVLEERRSKLSRELRG